VSSDNLPDHVLSYRLDTLSKNQKTLQMDAVSRQDNSASSIVIISMEKQHFIESSSEFHREAAKARLIALS